MNKIHFSSVFSFDDRLEHLKNFNPDTDIWVTSSLTLKKQIKYYLAQQHQCFYSASVLRVQELWASLFKKLYPDFSVKSESLIKAFLRYFLSKEKNNSTANNNYAQHLFSCIHSFLPIFISENSVEHFLDWLKKNPDPYLEDWFYLSFKAWKHLLENKIMSVLFLPAILSSDDPDLFDLLKNKNIIFDLGFQLKASETTCIKNLSKISSIKILKPSFYTKNLSDTSLWTYKLLKDVSLYQNYCNYNQQKDKKNIQSTKNKNIIFLSYSNQLAEIRSAIVQIKNFLKAGSNLNDIAIIAPNIEALWPVLFLQLSKENLPLNKALLSSLHSNKILMLWLAKLRLNLGGLSYSDLEMHYSSGDKKDISYQELKNTFFNLYSIEDYKKTKWSKHLLNNSLSEAKEINLFSFLDWAFLFWNFDKLNKNLPIDQKESDKMEQYIWEQVYQTLIVEGDKNIKLSPKSWLMYTEDILSKKIYSVQKKDFNGISLYNISDSDHLEEQNIIALDLSFDSLKSKTLPALSFSQVLSLSEDLGLSLDSEWGSHLEAVLKYVIQLKNKNIICSWSENNLEAKASSASAFFLEEHFKANDTNLQKTNIHPNPLIAADLKQMQYKTHLQTVDKKLIDLSLSKVLYDQNMLSMPKVENNLKSVSITKINRYTECPFIFFSENILKLEDLPDWDLDINAMKKGSLLHKLLELIITENILEEKDIERLFVKLKTFCAKEKIDDKSLNSLKDPLTAIAKQFIAQEQEQKKLAPNLKVLSTELALEAYWVKDKKDLQINTLATDKLLIKGKLDRLDVDKDKVLIRDYKTKINKQTHYTSWHEKKDLSLFLYYKLWKATAKTPPAQNNLLAAFYTDIYSLESKGFLSADLKTYDIIGLKPLAIATKEKTEDLFLQLDTELNQLLNNLLENQFAPKPIDKDKTCSRCKWSGLCRISKHF